MCKQRGHQYCTELGSDPKSWSNQTPLPRPASYEKSWEVFKQALTLEAHGEIDSARHLISTDKGEFLRDWFDMHAQNAGEWRRKKLGLPAPIAQMELDPVKTFSKYLNPILERDNFRCRYCTKTILTRKRLRLFHTSMGPGYFPIGRRNIEMSGHYLVSCATLDHVLPHSLGGRTHESNLVSACWPCNYGKMNYTLEQIGLENPLMRNPLPLELPLEILNGSNH